MESKSSIAPVDAIYAELREHYLIDGKPVNEAIFGIISRDWNASRAR